MVNTPGTLKTGSFICRFRSIVPKLVPFRYVELQLLVFPTCLGHNSLEICSLSSYTFEGHKSDKIVLNSLPARLDSSISNQPSEHFTMIIKSTFRFFLVLYLYLLVSTHNRSSFAAIWKVTLMQWPHEVPERFKCAHAFRREIISEGTDQNIIIISFNTVFIRYPNLYRLVEYNSFK